jgi:hypothetical protein
MYVVKLLPRLTIFLLITTYSNTANIKVQSTEPAEQQYIRTTDGLVYTRERLNFTRVSEHISLWIRDHENSTEYDLFHILATQSMQEVSVLTRALQYEAQARKHRTLHNMEEHSWLDDTDTIHRTKRNVFGNILHALTGVATDEELAQQASKEEALRKRLEKTLSKQLAFEKATLESIKALNKEEETIETRLRTLEAKQELDITKTFRLMMHHSVVQDDLQKLEDTMDAIVTGYANTRHSIFLTSRATLSHTAIAFNFHDITATKTGVEVTYLTRIYKKDVVLDIEKEKTHMTIKTIGSVYIVNPNYDLTKPLTEREVKLTKYECPTCAMLTHIRNGQYNIYRGGLLDCGIPPMKTTLNLTAGHILTLMTGEQCQNAAIVINCNMQNTRIYQVDVHEDITLDALLLRKTNAAARMDTLAQMSRKHGNNAHKMQQELDQAANALEDIKESSDTGETLQFVATSVTGSWLTIISIVIIIIILLILKRYVTMKKFINPPVTVGVL